MTNADSTLPSRARLSCAWWLCLLLAGCATAPREPSRPLAEVRSEIVRRMPDNVADRSGWAVDIQTAFDAQRIPANSENICAALAVTEQESGFHADPTVPNLPAIARAEINRRAAALHVPALVVDTALKIHSPDGRTYEQRLRNAHTERELSAIYEDLIDRVPLGKRLLADRNPVQTAGPMQVSVTFAEANAESYPYPFSGSLRDEVFTRRGGVYFGIADLLGYQTPYTRKLYRFADYNAGWYASRNAAFQNAVAIATGITLALDGDLLNPGAPLDKPGQTERAMRTLGGKLGMDNRAIRKALQLGNQLAFGDTDLYARTYALAEARAGKPLPRAMLPGIRLESPKITRNLTTGWFATRVDERYQRCMQR